MPIIEVKGLRKDFFIAKRSKGLFQTLKSLFVRKYTKKEAVKTMDFTISKGEMVGYIGPNGAGKSTTIKMLTGILVPTEGSVVVNGIIPYENRQQNAKNIGVVFGQRTQLWWDLPTIESFELLKVIYQVPDERYETNMQMFNEILGVNEFLNTPVRQLSLGQRMRADIAAALLHDPEILFLDEPTIGMDVVAKEKMRTFIKEINEKKQVTVILTTHDMEDIEQLCKRMILIDQGKKVYDGDIAFVKEQYGKTRTLIVELDKPLQLTNINLEIKEEKANKYHITFQKDKFTASQLISIISKEHEIKDLSVVETSIESIISTIYQEGFVKNR